jgi:hypothetical protein
MTKLEQDFYGRMPFLTPTKLNPGMRLGASVAFALNSIAQGPVTPPLLSVQGIEPAPHGLPARHCNHSATGASPGADGWEQAVQYVVSYCTASSHIVGSHICETMGSYSLS